VRILQVSSLERGGPLEQTLLLTAGLVTRGHQVRVISASADIARRFEATGAQAVVLPFGSGLDLSAARRLWRHMREVDVVHAQDRRAGLWTRLAPDLRRVARIYTVHGLPDSYGPPPLGSDRPPLRDRLAYEGLDAQLCRRADAVIIPSQTLAITFRDRLGFPAGRIRVVANGVPLPDQPLNPGEKVGTLSLLEPVKDIPTFLAAAALLAEDRRDLRFVVFGEGSQRTALENRARELGLADRVAFPGFVPSPQALAQLAVLVLPSIVENAPMALLEAMAAGIPAVASRTGGIPEIAGENGVLLTTPGDAGALAAAIGGLLADPEQAAARAAAARSRIAAHFSVDANVDGTLRVYEQALAARRAS
jgi:glycosyltransferase involved in cell wall biosynthesis